jgi:vacuolar-type H+-ATPase catalytic subunit A/Vma1
MASIVHITLAPVATPRGAALPVFAGVPLVTGQTLTSSASNQQGTGTVPAGYDAGKAVWRIAIGSQGDKDIYVAIGPSPDATAAAGRFLCPAGGVYDFASGAVGDKVAIVEA